MFVYDTPIFSKEDIDYWKSAFSGAKFSHYKAGQHLFWHGHPATYTFLLINGTIKDYVETGEGKRLTYYIAEPPYCGGIGKTISGKRYYNCNSVAITPLDVIKLTGDEINALCEEHHRFYDIFTQIDKIKILRLHNGIDTMFVSAPCRLSRFLYESIYYDYLKWDYDDYRINISQNDIAELLGLDRSNVSSVPVRGCISDRYIHAKIFFMCNLP